jgi:hypothetical protein
MRFAPPPGKPKAAQVHTGETLASKYEDDALTRHVTR